MISGTTTWRTVLFSVTRPGSTVLFSVMPPGTTWKYGPLFGNATWRKPLARRHFHHFRSPFYYRPSGKNSTREHLRWTPRGGSLRSQEAYRPRKAERRCLSTPRELRPMPV